MKFRIVKMVLKIPLVLRQKKKKLKFLKFHVLIRTETSSLLVTSTAEYPFFANGYVINAENVPKRGLILGRHYRSKVSAQGNHVISDEKRK